MTRALLLFAALSLAACGGSREVASGTVTDAEGNSVTYSVKQNGSGTTTTVQTGDGTATIRTGDTSAALPAGLTLYPGATVTSSMHMSGSGEQKGGTMLAFESSDAPEQIVAFYKTAAQRAGYTIEGEITAGTMRMLTGKRGANDETGFSLTVNRAENKSEATLVAGA